ncbi:MAG: class I SAM-dependent methyltransferase [Burkholderiaceae bacterium]
MSFKNPRETWDKRFRDADGYLFGTEPNAWLVESARFLAPASTVFCVADGEGRNSTYLAGLGHSVHAADLSPVAIEKLRALAAERDVTVFARVEGIEDWSWPEQSLDAVVAIFIQFAAPVARALLFERIAASLRPHGLLIIEGYGLRQLRYRTGGPGVAENLYDQALFASTFEGWQVLAARDVDTHVSEGSGHRGRSHLVSAVLRKPG